MGHFSLQFLAISRARVSPFGHGWDVNGNQDQMPGTIFSAHNMHRFLDHKAKRQATLATRIFGI